MVSYIDKLLQKWKFEDVLRALYDTCKTNNERIALLDAIRSHINPIDWAILKGKYNIITSLNIV